MQIKSEKNTSIEFNPEKIKEFISLIKKCSTPVVRKKLRIISRYKVEFRTINLTYVYLFRKISTGRFEMDIRKNGKNGDSMGTFSCDDMEWFLNDYK